MQGGKNPIILINLSKPICLEIKALFCYRKTPIGAFCSAFVYKFIAADLFSNPQITSNRYLIEQQIKER